MRLSLLASLVALTVLPTCPAAAAESGHGFNTPLEVAEALLEEMGLDAGTCPETLPVKLGDDLQAACARNGAGHKQTIKALEGALAQRRFSGIDFLPVSKWRNVDKTWQRTAWWIGGASIEVLSSRKSGDVAILASRVYPRCGNDVRFVPALAAKNASEAPLFLSPSSYPDGAAKMKLDGSVALALTIDAEGRSSVRCIHHASPLGYGFELPAIEAAREMRQQLVLEDGAARDRVLNVVVSFSKRSERGKLQGVRYHD
jgi:hypothetical protein